MTKKFQYLLFAVLLALCPVIVQGETTTSPSEEVSSSSSSTETTLVSSSSSSTEDLTSGSSSNSETTLTSQDSTSNTATITPEIPKETLKTTTATLATSVIKTQAMYRLYNPNSGEHFYTASAYEAREVIKAKWNYEGVGWHAPVSGVPVYRLYNPNAGDHHYTLNGHEKNDLISRGWRYEGIGWYSDQNQSLELYRAYNPNAQSGSHNYTLNGNEQNVLLRAGWRNEGISWYGSGVRPESSEDAALQALYQQIINSRPQIGKPNYYSQKDSRWSGNRFNSSTIGPSGCVPTSLAMILSGSYGMNLTPADVAARMDGYSSWAFGASGKDIIATANSYGHSVEVVSSQAVAEQRLREGYPLIWLVNVGIGHAVVSFGNSGGKTEVLDPYDRQFINGWQDISFLWGKLSRDPMDWDAGVPVFVIK